MLLLLPCGSPGLVFLSHQSNLTESPDPIKGYPFNQGNLPLQKQQLARYTLFCVSAFRIKDNPVASPEMKQRLDTSDNSSTCDDLNGRPDLHSRELNAGKRKCLARDVHSVSSPPTGRHTKSGKTDEENPKCCKVAEDTKEKGDLKGKVEECNHAEAGESSPKETQDNAKPSLVSVKQDYIHVRARRGQATDSHSLAERVRREKISARMKLLQGLVPGCSKITGKAVMLDEIINYVQSLQRQVEFLSMKLAAVSPRLDFNLEGENLAKDSQMLQSPCSFASKPFTPEGTAAYPYPQLQKGHMQFLFAPHAEGPVMGNLGPHAEGPVVGNLAEISVGRTRTAQLLGTNVYEDPMFQVSNAGDDELQSGFPIVLEQNRHTPFTSQGVHGSLATDHLKVEL